MRKCRNCICRICLNVCCNESKCPGVKKKCAEYNSFEQMGAFLPSQEPKREPAPRKSWEEYGLGDRERRTELRNLAQSSEYAEIARNCAHIAAPEIEGYILLSVTENLSYEGIEKAWARGDIDRMACGKSDFYGYKRFFYHLFDERMKKMF